MRLYVLLLIVSVAQAFGSNIYSQSAMLTFRMNNASIEDVLNAIEEQSEFRFLYNKKMVDVERRVDIAADNGNITDVLDNLFRDAEISYAISDRQIVLNRKGAFMMLLRQAGRRVAGTVVDRTGEPIIGANVIEKGSAANGAVTDVDGQFSLTVADDAVLQVSFIGYITQEVAASSAEGGRSLLITLLEDERLLEEVVVVGYGMQKKVNLTGSISTMKTEEIQAVPASNLSNALAGRLAGVTVTQSEGGRPGNASDIKIRVGGTWNNTDPLYVIDGVTRNKFAFDGLDASDIENISILKDGASAAIYGSRSANGVVLVTTRRGKEGKPTINYTGSVGVSSPTQYVKTQDAYHQALFINDRYLYTAKRPADDPLIINADELEYFRNNSHDWMEETWQNPVVSHHAVNVSGGTDRVRYFLGGAYYYETGGFNNMTFDRYSFRANLEANITRDLIVGLDLNTDVRDDLKPYWRNDQGHDSLDDYFNMLLFYGTGMRPSFIDGLPVANDMSNNFALLSSKEYGYTRRRYANTEATVSLKYDVPAMPGLSVKLLYNNYLSHKFTKEFVHPVTWYDFEPTRPGGYVLTGTVRGVKTRDDGNFVNERYDGGRSYQFNGYINYDRTFGKHDVSAVFIYEASEGFDDWFRGEVRNYASNLVDQLDAGSKEPNDRTVEGTGSENGRESYAGRIHYAYDSRYMLEVSARYDGSVMFAPEKRWGFFPSASAAWRVSEETFFKDNIRFISSLKLRGSVGLLGNDFIDTNDDGIEDRWQWKYLYSLTSGAQYGTGAIGVEPKVIPNQDVTWEKSLAWNGGADLGFLKNKLTFGFDFFKKHTYDILGTRIKSLPTTSGLNLAAENYGVMDSHGFEIEAAYTESLTNDLDVRIGGNLGYAVNKLVMKDEAENLPAYRSELGFNTDRKRGYIYDDIIRTQADLDALPEGYTIEGRAPELGMINYKDIRGVTGDAPDDKITEEDKDWIINHTTPPVIYGFKLGAGWKGIDLDLFFQGVSGNELFVGYRDQNARVAKTNPDFWSDHWTPENIDAKYPRPENGNSQGYPESTFWLRDGSFLRLRNITLSYTFPKHLLSSLKVSQLKVFFTGNNLFLLEDHVKDFDPEFGNEDANIKRYPIMKSTSFGLNLSF
ncbi:MAG: TonB-dependent receptor [Tannerella sp.]|nr:TonB-dependent receptor [Tannerella sp.]